MGEQADLAAIAAFHDECANRCARFQSSTELAGGGLTLDVERQRQFHESAALTLKALQPAAADLVVVPRVATEVMLEAALTTGSRFGKTSMANIWSAMLKAAAPSVEGGQSA